MKRFRRYFVWQPLKKGRKKLFSLILLLSSSTHITEKMSERLDQSFCRCWCSSVLLERKKNFGAKKKKEKMKTTFTGGKTFSRSLSSSSFPSADGNESIEKRFFLSGIYSYVHTRQDMWKRERDRCEDKRDNNNIWTRDTKGRFSFVSTRSALASFESTYFFPAASSWQVIDWSLLLLLWG